MPQPTDFLKSSPYYRQLTEFVRRERFFLFIILAGFFLCGIFYQNTAVAMWLGFTLAAYSAVSNDSIQTIGTFISSNANKKWWVLWLFIGVIFLGTVTVSWVLFEGDVSYKRLTSKGFDQSPQSFAFLQVAAPVFLLIITRLRMPVSTTFLLLSAFSTNSSAILEVIMKSVSGYAIAFITSITIWMLASRFLKKLIKGKAHFAWTIAQWITSGTLWSVWIMQDAANIAVFLPRQLNIWEFSAFSGTIFCGLGLIFFLKGDKIQSVINEKSDTKDVRSATVIDFVYAVILFIFQYVSTIPMSTTWVFIGLLAGRELGMHFTGLSSQKLGLKQTMRLIGKDMLFTLIGLLVSIILAVSVNPLVREELLRYFQ